MFSSFVLVFLRFSRFGGLWGGYIRSSFIWKGEDLNGEWLVVTYLGLYILGFQFWRGWVEGGRRFRAVGLIRGLGFLWFFFVISGK